VTPAQSGRPVEGPAVARVGSGAWARVFALAGVVLALDQITKQIAVSTIQRGDPFEIMFGFELANVRNKGVAFGLLADGEVPVLLLTLGALALLVVYFAFHSETPSLWVAVGLLCGGALGNLADRLRIDAVIDFLDPPLWPAFNLADVAIVAGVVLLIVTLGGPDRPGGSIRRR
jgi:signal peptidase II